MKDDHEIKQWIDECRIRLHKDVDKRIVDHAQDALTRSFEQEIGGREYAPRIFLLRRFGTAVATVFIMIGVLVFFVQDVNHKAAQQQLPPAQQARDLKPDTEPTLDATVQSPLSLELAQAQRYFQMKDIASLILLLENGLEDTQIVVADYLSAVADDAALEPLGRLSASWCGDPAINPFKAAIEQIERRQGQVAKELDESIPSGQEIHGSAVDANAGPVCPFTLAELREKVHENEQKIRCIQLDYHIEINSPDVNATHVHGTWAQQEDTQFHHVTLFQGVRHLSPDATYVFDGEQFLGSNDYRHNTWSIERDPIGRDYPRGFHDRFFGPLLVLGFRPVSFHYPLSTFLIDPYARLHPYLKEIDGRPTCVVDVKDPYCYGNFSRLWVDTERYRPLRIHHFIYTSDVNRDFGLNDSIDNIQLYQLPNQAWIPVSGILSTRKDFNHVLATYRVTVETDRITTGHADVPETLFRFTIPEGAQVINGITGHSYTQGEKKQTVDQIIEDSIATISGIVIDQSGNPIPDVVVRSDRYNTPSNGALVSPFKTSFPRPCAMTDSQGRFALDLDPVMEQERLSDQTQFNLVLYPKDHARLYVPNIYAGENELVLILDPGVTIAGRVMQQVQGQHVPVPYLPVFLRDITEDDEPRFDQSIHDPVTTDEEGQFAFEHVCIKRPDPVDPYDRDYGYTYRRLRVFCPYLNLAYGVSTVLDFSEDQTSRQVELVIPEDPPFPPLDRSPD